MATMFLLTMALLVRYVDYMRARPWRFIKELLVISVVTSMPIFYVAYKRRSSYKRATRDFLVLTLTGAALWVLFELAGVNSTIFPPRERNVPYFDLSREEVWSKYDLYQKVS